MNTVMSDALKPLIFVEPLTSTLMEMKMLIEEKAEEEGIEIYEVEDIAEFGQLIPTVGQCLTICGSPKRCAMILQEHKKIIKQYQAKTILLTPKAIPRKTLDKFMKIGLTECIVEPVNQKTLMYKIRLQLRSITAKSEDEDDRNNNSGPIDPTLAENGADNSVSKFRSEKMVDWDDDEDTNKSMRAEKGVDWSDDDSNQKQRTEKGVDWSDDDKNTKGQKRKSWTFDDPEQVHKAEKGVDWSDNPTEQPRKEKGVNWEDSEEYDQAKLMGEIEVDALNIDEELERARQKAEEELLSNSKIKANLEQPPEDEFTQNGKKDFLKDNDPTKYREEMIESYYKGKQKKNDLLDETPEEKEAREREELEEEEKERKKKIELQFESVPEEKKAKEENFDEDEEQKKKRIDLEFEKQKEEPKEKSLNNIESHYKGKQSGQDSLNDKDISKNNGYEDRIDEDNLTGESGVEHQDDDVSKRKKGVELEFEKAKKEDREKDDDSEDDDDEKKKRVDLEFLTPEAEKKEAEEEIEDEKEKKRKINLEFEAQKQEKEEKENEDVNAEGAKTRNKLEDDLDGNNSGEGQVDQLDKYMRGGKARKKELEKKHPNDAPSLTQEEEEDKQNEKAVSFSLFGKKKKKLEREEAEWEDDKLEKKKSVELEFEKNPLAKEDKDQNTDEDEEGKRKDSLGENIDNSPLKGDGKASHEDKENKVGEGQVDHINKYYSSKESILHQDDKKRERPIWEKQEEEAKAKSEDIQLDYNKKTEHDEYTIDYRKLKKEFEAIQYEVPKKKKVWGENTDLTKIPVTYTKKVIGLEGSLEDIVFERPEEDEQEEAITSIFEPESKGLEYAIDLLNLYFLPKTTTLELTNHLNGIIKDHFGGALVCYSFKEDPLPKPFFNGLYAEIEKKRPSPLTEEDKADLSRSELKEIERVYGEEFDLYQEELIQSKLKFEEDFGQKLAEWKEFKTPKWKDHTFQAEQNEFVFPFYEAGSLLGLIAFIPTQEKEDFLEKWHSLEALLEIARGLILNEREPVKDKEKEKVVNSSPNKEEAQRTKKGFFGRLFGKAS